MNDADKEFESILLSVVDYLDNDSKINPDRYKNSGEAFETPVVESLINLVGKENLDYKQGSHSFPDIRIRGTNGAWWGIEVKSTTKSSWKINGNSILGENRAKDLSDVYVLFGMLKQSQSQFKFRRLEDSISDVAVTHSPRFLIDFSQDSDHSLFKKIGITMHEFEQIQNPIQLILDYYQSLGKEAWWLPQNSNFSDASPFEITYFNDLSEKEKNNLIAFALVHYPEVLMYKSPQKYNRFVKYLAISKSVLCSNVRDVFSAGGQFEIQVNNQVIKLPHVFKTIMKYRKNIVQIINEGNPNEIIEDWKMLGNYIKGIQIKSNIDTNNIFQEWIEVCSQILSFKTEYTCNEIKEIISSVFAI